MHFINVQLHDTINHANPRQYKSSIIIIQTRPHTYSTISERNITKNDQSCDPCIVGKAKRTPFSDVKDSAKGVLDAVSTNTTRTINPSDIDGNVYLQLLVDAASGNTQVFPMKKTSDAPAAIL